ncbi:FAST kinase domain-containing protein 3, mitochondrial [Antennarius striatus]|uniref:FAST kinase domain-containing protein 3, mitochondrial n=1 Tax=Antennarius striatus TaxID=241820 RepID=UPI0035B33D49
MRVMALKLMERCLIQRYPPVEPVSPAGLLNTRNVGQLSRLPFLCTPVIGCIQRQGFRKLLQGCGRRGLTATIIRERFFVTSRSGRLHSDSGLPQFHLSRLHQPTTEDKPAFQEQLRSCSSSEEVFTLLHSVETMSATMAAAALHRVADLEQEGTTLKDPSVLEKDTIRALCFQLEQDSQQLTDDGLVSALLACTRIFLDRRSTVMERLVSETKGRLDRRQMSVGQLCILGDVMLAVEGPHCIMLEQVMEQIQIQKPAQWSPEDLIGVYKFMQSGSIQIGKYQKLLNAMNSHFLKVAPHMNPAAVSGMFSALVAFNHTNVMPLVVSLCEQAARHVPHFTDEELTAVLLALMHFDHSNHSFVEALENYVPKMTFSSHPETVTTVIHFFGHMSILSPSVVDAIAESFVYRADCYSTSQVTKHIMALGKLGYLPPNANKVFRKVEHILYTRFSQFQPHMLLNLFHSCILVERFPLNFVDKVFSVFFLLKVHDPNIKLNWHARAQLTQLWMAFTLECPFYEGPMLHSKNRVKSLLASGHSLETPMDLHLFNSVQSALVHLLGSPSYFDFNVLTPNCYTLDVEIKLNQKGYVLPTHNTEDVTHRLALCIDGKNRFTTNKRQLLGKEATKQRHLRLLGYELIQVPYYELEKLKSKTSMVDYLHQKIFPLRQKIRLQ